MENGLLAATVAIIVIEYVLGVVVLKKEKEILGILGPTIETRRDLFLVKEAAEASKKGAMLLLLLFGAYMTYLLIAKFGFGYNLSKYLFVFGAATLPFAFSIKVVENRLKKMAVASVDPAIHEAYRSILYQWKKKPGLRITIKPPRRKTGLRT